MKQRINISQLEPEAYKILFEMEDYLARTNVSFKIRELIKIRVSQINKCAYCITIHTKDARKAGETEQRIYALPAWEESRLFSDEERAVLAFTDEVTKISEQGVTNHTYENMQQYFTDQQIAQITIAIGQINFWNRIAVTSKVFHNG